jgi:threonine aldolase
VGKRFLSPSGLSPSRQPQQVLTRSLHRVDASEAEEDAVPRLEQHIAELLGKPAAAMFPTGTMAQQVAMRVHADQRGIRSIAFHPQCHLEQHEHKGYSTVHGLTGVLVGDPNLLIELSDLEEVHEPIAALLLELPQREIGGLLPEWNDLVAQTEWARARGAAVHMDGARLWESQPYYDRPHAEIAGLFDTVYVSLYKALAGMSGAMLAGEADVIKHAVVWRDRLGGDVSRNWPMVLAAERGLSELLPRMREFAERARRLAALLAEIPGVNPVPNPPQTPMFHLYYDAPREAVVAAAQQLRAEGDLMPPRWVRPMPSGRHCNMEFNVSENLDEVTDAEIGDLIEQIIKRAQASSEGSAGGSTSPRMA